MPIIMKKVLKFFCLEIIEVFLEITEVSMCNSHLSAIARVHSEEVQPGMMASKCAQPKSILLCKQDVISWLVGGTENNVMATGSSLEQRDLDWRQEVRKKALQPERSLLVWLLQESQERPYTRKWAACPRRFHYEEALKNPCRPLVRGTTVASRQHEKKQRGQNLSTRLNFQVSLQWVPLGTLSVQM